MTRAAADACRPAERATAGNSAPSALIPAGTETTFASLVQMAATGRQPCPSSPAPPPAPSPVAIAPLPSIRTAEPFERLRDVSDAYLAKTGERPQVFLANLGPIAAFTARARFAKNFFEAGGIEAVMNDGFLRLSMPSPAPSRHRRRSDRLCSSEVLSDEAQLRDLPRRRSRRTDLRRRTEAASGA